MTPFWDNRVAMWVSFRLWDKTDGFDRCVAMGVEHKGELAAGLVFHNWEPESGTIEISAAASDRRWMTRTVINTALNYVFDNAQCQMILVRIQKQNTAARKIWLGLGGTEIVIPRLYGPKSDGSLITLTDDQWQGSKFKDKAHG